MFLNLKKKSNGLSCLLFYNTLNKSYSLSDYVKNGFDKIFYLKKRQKKKNLKHKKGNKSKAFEKR